MSNPLVVTRLSQDSIRRRMETDNPTDKDLNLQIVSSKAMASDKFEAKLNASDGVSICPILVSKSVRAKFSRNEWDKVANFCII